jgi:NAD(P)-dependent dehydrogenase (short-subunit alcohol dehydrogenase family)
MAGEVWIIGASRGLGREIARRFDERGRKVVGVARHAPADLSGFDAFATADATDPDGLDAVLQRLYAEGRRPDLIVYCAARVYQGPLVRQPDTALRAEVDCNYLGFVRLCQAVAAFKPPEVPVRLVATGSTLGYVGCPSLDNYSATKAALFSFARSARRELAGHRIAIQILSPPHMDNGSADLRGPQPFSLERSAEQFVRAAERGGEEHLIGASNRLVPALMRLWPGLARAIMDRIGADALRRGASRTPA